MILAYLLVESDSMTVRFFSPDLASTMYDCFIVYEVLSCRHEVRCVILASVLKLVLHMSIATWNPTRQMDIN